MTSKLQYVQPRITEYGQLAEITLGSTGTLKELNLQGQVIAGQCNPSVPATNPPQVACVLAS